MPSAISKRVYRHISQDVCPWNVKFSQALANDSPFRAREFIAGKDAVTLATDILALDQEQFRAAFRKSSMMRAKSSGEQMSRLGHVSGLPMSAASARSHGELPA